MIDIAAIAGGVAGGLVALIVAVVVIYYALKKNIHITAESIQLRGPVYKKHT